jgi:sigma-B regulation protein RsbU (phosphoserine phosphatase)
MGQGITGWVAQHGESVIIPDISSDPRYHQTSEQFSDSAVRSMLSIPLKVKGTVIGVLNLADPQVNRFSEEDLQFVESITAAAAISIENARLYQEVRNANEFLEQRVQERTRELAETIKAKERIESELRIAHNIQMGSLPHTFPDRSDLDLYAVLEPAKEVGGDFYDFFFTDDRHLWFVVGDVSGKGVPAALFMSAAKTLIKAIALRLSPDQEGACIGPPQPAAVLATVNRELSLNNDSCMFATVFCGVLNTQTGEVCYTNAGHNAPLLLRRDGEPAFVARSNCGVIGPVEDTVFTSATLQIQQGERLLLYTDGVTEAFNRQKEQFSEERLQEAVTGHPEATAEGIVNTVLSHVQAFAADVPQWDDITILTVTYCP